MGTLINIFSPKYTIFSMIGYNLSLIELIGIITGLLSVFFATRRNPLTWTIGLLNELVFFILFFQLQLYGEMMLQVLFAVITVYGWVNWRAFIALEPGPIVLSAKLRLLVIVIIGLATYFYTIILSQLHLVFPGLFLQAAAFPIQDSFISIMSVMAVFLLAKNAIENWVLWIITDLVSIYLYFLRGIPFMAALYLVFLLLAIHGLYSWLRTLGYNSEKNMIKSC
jgi:nicotinamide mononucleotide transporter